MRYLYYSITLFLFFVDCKTLSRSEECKTTLEFGKNNIYYITLPCDKIEKRFTDDHSRISYKFRFQNEITFFVNDYVDETPHFVYKQMSLDYREVPSFVFYDSITIQGIDERNKSFWKAVKNKGVVMGYENVPENRKEEFDKAILSLIKKDK